MQKTPHNYFTTKKASELRHKNIHALYLDHCCVHVDCAWQCIATSIIYVVG